MKFAAAIISCIAGVSQPFTPATIVGKETNNAAPSSLTSSLFAIRRKTDKSEELRFGWDGTTALGGAVEYAKPSRMLDEIRASGETIPDSCHVFNANIEMNSDNVKFAEVMDLIDAHYEVGLIDFKNGEIVNKQGENEGSAKLLSYAALSDLDKDTTLQLWGEYYREVVADPDGLSHPNIRNFMKYGWEGTWYILSRTWMKPVAS